MEGLRLLTVIAEVEVADRIAHDLRACGARGFAITEGRGEWVRAIADRDETFDGPVARIESVMPAEIAARAMAHLAAKWFPHYAVFAWLTQAEVLRPGRYSQ